MRSVRWEITPDQFSDFLRKLRFQYHKWDTFACGALRVVPESIVLTRQQHELIVSMTERLASILRGIEDRVKHDAKALRRIGIPPKVAELIGIEAESPMQLARYDFFPTPEGGWAVSEFNEDVPGGFNEIIAGERLLPNYHPGFQFVDRFAETFLDAIPSEGRVAFMYATGYSEDLQHMLVLQQLLEERGQTSLLCSPRHLKSRFGRLSVDGQRIDAVVRFYPGEWYPLLPNRRAWCRAVTKIPMMNPLRRLISQSKAVFDLWDQPGIVSKDDRDFLHTVAPETRCFRPEDEAILLDQPSQWVIKENFGRMGENVVMGSLVPSEHWQAAIQYAKAKPADHVIQRCFGVVPMQFSNGLLYPAIGAFVINGRFAGYYSRVAAEPFLTHQATYVPTVIDA
jgi:glutathionylspermidine synthase